MRCSMCGHDSPPGSLFCLSCGSPLQQAGSQGTPGGGAGLPTFCPACRTENPPGMKFCRHCGTVLPAPAPPGLSPSPMMGGHGMGGHGMGGAMPQMGPPPGMPQPGPMGGMHGMPPMAQPRPPSAPGVVAGSIGSPGSAPAAMPSACPRCGSATSPGFAFCQQCGMKLNVDAHAGTLAVSGPGPAPMPSPMPSPSPVAAAAAAPGRVAAGLAPTPAAGGWGAAVSVNRDGTDGERFPLSGEFVVVGRGPASGADIGFEQDRFLARQHARLEPTTEGAARVVPIDTLNGVFRKIDGPVELADGVIVLAGREVMRYEVVEPEEKVQTPLIRHGVALFGSPPREPWGRLVQLLPSGGVRDVRHLWDDEIVIGREDGELVFSDDQFLSRRHASIAWDGSRATLNDLGSSNGTFVRLTGPTTIKHGDHLRMGDQLFRIELRR